MSRKTTSLIAPVLCCLMVLPTLGAEQAKPPSTGTVRGVVKYVGKQPPRRPLRVGGAQFCAQVRAGKPVLAKLWMFGENDTLQNVLVWVSSGIDAKQYKPPTKPLEIDQRGCEYLPHVAACVAGQPVKIWNNDATLHNVQGIAKLNPSWNDGMPLKGMFLDKKLSKPELGIMLKCSVHPWMTAYLHVLPHSFFAITGEPGTFEITGLPPGEYELSVWHEFKRFVADKPTIKVRVEAGKTSEATFTYRVKKKESD